MKMKFVGLLGDAIGELGRSKDQFARHSLRIGAVLAATQAKLEDCSIMMVGQWSSAAILRYVITPKAVLTAVIARPSCVSAE